MLRVTWSDSSASSSGSAMFVPRSVLRPSTSAKEIVTANKKENYGTTAAAKSVTVVDLRAQDDEEEEEERINDITISPRTSHGDHSDEVVNDGVEEEDEVVSYSKHQRWPLPGEPVCVVCGRYGAYIVDVTEKDVCSLECKARQLKMEGVPFSVRITEEQEERKVKGEQEGGTRSEGVLSEKQISLWRVEMDVHVKGDDVPQPLLHIRYMQMCSKLEDNVASAGISHLTPVQMQAIPAVLAGRDILACSATGSGKTLSFLLPIVHLLSSSPHPTVSPTALILSPTRELCLQLEEQAKQLMKGLPEMLTAVLIGGIPLPQQLHRLKSNIQVVFGTPARIKELIENHASSLDLSRMRVLVLDEVDSLLQMGFEEQVRSIVDSLPRQRQNLMFSATIPSKIERLAAEMLSNPLYISVGKPSAPNSAIRHTVEWVEETAKKQRLFYFLKDRDMFKPPAVVFVSSKKGCLLLADAINKVCDVSVVCLHGDMAQERRSAILTGFLNGKYELVVSTGVLARGLVLPNVQQVFNFDMPSSMDEFIHQIGRAGRLGSPGWAITFINSDNKGVFCDLVDMLGQEGTHLPPQLLQSPSLALQRRRRKKQGQSEQLGTGLKRNFYDQKSLLELVQGRTQKKSRHSHHFHT